MRGWSNLEVSTSASARRARRSDATTYEQNKWIFLYTLQRTGFNTEVCSYFSLSWLDCDPSCEYLIPDVYQLTIERGARAMPDNGKWRPYDLKSRRTSTKSWLCQLLVCKQDKVASCKDLVFHSKVAMNRPGREKKLLQHNIVDLFPGIPTVPDRWSLHGLWT